jgi:hypothetical protein
MATTSTTNSSAEVRWRVVLNGNAETWYSEVGEALSWVDFLLSVPLSPGEETNVSVTKFVAQDKREFRKAY